MGDFRRTRIAGRSRGDANPLQIQQMQQRLAVATLKRHADMSGQPFPTVPIEHGLRNAVGDDRFESLCYFLQSFFRLLHVFDMILQGRRHSDDSRHILRLFEGKVAKRSHFDSFTKFTFLLLKRIGMT